MPSVGKKTFVPEHPDFLSRRKMHVLVPSPFPCHKPLLRPNAPFFISASRGWSYAEALATPRAPFWKPVWKPFLKRRGTSLRCRMRPVPTVFLRLAFSLQLSAQPNANGLANIPLEQMIRRTMISSRGVDQTRGGRSDGRTLPDARRRVAACCAGVLLDMHRPAT